LALLTVPLVFVGNGAHQVARSDGSPGLLFAWLVYSWLVPLPIAIALVGVYGVIKLMFMLHLRHSPSIPIQLVISAGLLYVAYRIGN
jgi:hypothetical protein